MNDEEKEWEELQKEIKEIDKKSGRTGVNIINKMIYIKKEKEKEEKKNGNEQNR